MFIRNLKPATRLYLWLVLAASTILVLIGVTGWFLGVARLDQIQKGYDDATAIAQGKFRPTVSPAKLNSLYQSGVTNFERGNYEQAAKDLEQVVATTSNYNDALARLLLSYKSLAEAQAGDAVRLEDATKSFEKAVTLSRSYSTLLKQQFVSNPRLLPANAGTYEAMSQSLEQERSWADRYFKGSSGQTTRLGWWDSVIGEWEALYRDNPDYLKNNPDLSLSTRLSDTYLTKAVYLCKIKADFGGALAAGNRALEIARKNQLPEVRQRLFTGLINNITQTQCQAG